MVAINKEKIIQQFRGLESNLPKLLDGQFGFTTDTKKLFIGSDVGNVKITNEEEIKLIKNSLNAILKEQLENGEVVDSRLESLIIDITDTQANLEILSSKVTELNDLISSTSAVKSETVNAGVTEVNSAIKSPVNIGRIDGRTIVNHVPLFDSGMWEIPQQATSISPNKLVINATGNNQYLAIRVREVKENQSYTLSLNHNATIAVNAYSKDGFISTLISYTIDKSVTFVTPSKTNLLEIYFNNGELGAGVFTFENVSLVEGSQPQPFVANIKGLTNPTIANETNGTSLVIPTTLHDGEYVELDSDGHLVKYKKWQEKLLDGSENYFFASANNNRKSVMLRYLPNSVFAQNTVMSTKYNGIILPYVVGEGIKSDTIRWTNSGELSFEISNDDSGWGESYSPTSDEIKAYFLGWKMYNSNSAYSTNYNNAGVKSWCYRDPSVTTGNELNIGFTGGTSELPTNQAPINSRWQPYKIVYELNVPMQEIINPYGGLTLEKGINNLDVRSGRILNESVKYVFVESGAFGIFNSTFYTETYTKLKYMVDKSVNMYKDGKIFKSYYAQTDDPNKFGKERYVIQNIDTTSSYTIDYEPLNTWEITAPIESIEIKYQLTLGGVVERLVEESAEQQSAISTLNDSTVKKDEKAKWITPTLINGFVSNSGAPIRFCKTSSGIVIIEGNFEVTNGGNIAFILPVNYRPLSYIRVSAVNVENPSDGLNLVIYSDGKVLFNKESTREVGVTTAFKAYQ